MSRYLLLNKASLWSLAISVIAVTAQTSWGQTAVTARRFDFGNGILQSGYTQVLPEHVYSEQAGFGFEPGAMVQSVSRGGANPLNDAFCTSQEPFYFSVKLPEGNYLVTLTLGDAAGESTTSVKAELRRLMLENIKTSPGKSEKHSMTVNVRTPKIAGGTAVRLKDREKATEMWAWDEKLTLEFSGTRPCVCAMEIIQTDDVPTLFLLGDSTVCDQPREPYASWGQMLPRFLKPGIAVANHAESGESLRSSLGAKRLDKVLSCLREGDWVFIQFGHNDMKSVNAAAYKVDLKRYVAEVRLKGGKPVLITPVHRRTFDGDKITNSHRDFPDAVREAAAEDNVPLIDLWAMSQKLYEAWGPERSVDGFSTPRDGTHHNNYGAYELAKCVIEGIRQNKLDVAKYIREDVPVFDSSRPDAFATFAVPASPRVLSRTHDGD